MVLFDLRVPGQNPRLVTRSDPMGHPCLDAARLHPLEGYHHVWGGGVVCGSHNTVVLTPPVPPHHDRSRILVRVGGGHRGYKCPTHGSGLLLRVTLSICEPARVAGFTRGLPMVVGNTTRSKTPLLHIYACGWPQHQSGAKSFSHSLKWVSAQLLSHFLALLVGPSPSTLPHFNRGSFSGHSNGADL